MNRRLVSTLVFGLTTCTMALSASDALAAEPDPVAPKTEAIETARNGIHVDPLSIATGTIGLGYERVLGDHFAVRLEGRYVRNWLTGNDIWGVGASVRPSVFFFRPAPGGMYISPILTVAYVSGERDGVTATGTGWAVGGTVGYSWVIGRHFNIRAGAGAQYGSTEVTSGTTKIGYKGVLPAADLSVGVLF